MLPWMGQPWQKYRGKLSLPVAILWGGKIVIIVKKKLKGSGSGGIRTHAPEETGALNQRLRPLGHATLSRQPEI